MATMTRVLLLQRLSEQFNDWWAGTTTGAGGATTTVDTALAQLDGGDDDFCVNWYVRNVATGQIRRILPTSGYATATGTITHASMTAVGNAAAYELHRINPTLKHNALLRASVLCFPGGSRHGLYLPLRDETLVVDNLIATNFGFETAVTGGESTGWTRVSTPTLTDETTIRMHGTNSLKIVGTGTDYIYQGIDGNADFVEVVGKTVHFHCWIWADTASSTRIGLSFDSGSTFTWSSYHGGADEWENMEVSAAVPADWTTVRVYIEVTDATSYADLARAWVDPTHRYTLSTDFSSRNPFAVLQQVYDDKPEGPYAPISAYGRPTAGRVLRVTGMGLLEQPTTDAGTVTIDTTQAEYFLAQAAQWLYRAIMQGGSQQEREYIRQLRQDWQQDIAEMEQGGTTMDNMAAQNPMGVWKVDPSGGTKYLVFQQGR